MQTSLSNQVCLTLGEAIEGGEIRPVFQPIVRLDNGEFTGFEVLARWNHATEGNISPLIFIPYAEQNELIGTLMRRVIRDACAQAVHWRGNFLLNFNISPMQFNDRKLYDSLAEAAEFSEFPLDRIVLEMTEREAIAKPSFASAIIKELNEVGIKLALDDFGAGYGDLMRLHAFPFRYVKIDARLVEPIMTDKTARRIITSIIGLGKRLQFEVIAEGVETEEQAQILREDGCQLAQGWLFSHPLEIDAAAHYAETR